MKILYDHQIFAIQEFGGVSRYFLELITQLKKTEGIEIEISLKYSNNEYLENFNFIKFKNFFRKFSFPGKGPLLNQMNKVHSIPRIRRREFDVFHPTYYDPYFLHYLKKKPFIVTVYDMIHEIYPNYFSRYDGVRKHKRTLAHAADAVIAISQNTKNDLVSIYQLDPDKIHVIYLGNPLHDQQCDKALTIGYTENNSIPSEYLLFVGNRKHYKNFQFFVNAIRPLFIEYPDLSVVCAGGGKFSKDEESFLDRSGINEKITQVPADDQGLLSLYAHAKAFVFPSLYEGFGLPVLEAFSCGCPVLLSNTSSLPEVGGDAAHYFYPLDAESIRTAIKVVLNSESTRERMINEGKKQLKKFNWEIAAHETKKIYESVSHQ